MPRRTTAPPFRPSQGARTATRARHSGQRRGGRSELLGQEKGTAFYRRLRFVEAKAATNAEFGGRQSVMPAKRLGELGRLAVTDLESDAAHGIARIGEEFGGAIHADGRQDISERGFAD